MKRIKNSNSKDGNNLKTKTVEDQKTVTNIKAPILSPSCSRHQFTLEYEVKIGIPREFKLVCS